MLRWSFCLALLLVSGCFRYAPVPADAPEPARGERVRIHTSAPIDARAGETTVHNIVQVEGEVVSWADDRLLLSARYMRSARDLDFLGDGHTVQVPREVIARVEQRRLDVFRTAGLAGGAILIPVIIAAILESPGGSTTGGGGNGGQPQ